jgi:choline dehydrogenase-like flavoprotein
MAHFLNDAQYEALSALCDTLIPSLEPPPGVDEATAAYYRRAAADLDVARYVTRAIRDYATPESQAQTKQFLTLLTTASGTLALTGQPRKFASLPFAIRERILQRWAVSPIGLLRQGFQGIKRLAHSMFFSLVDEAGHNPNWAAIRYPGPPAQPVTPPPTAIHPRAITQDTILDCDVVVVGSGAGGGVVAGVLAQAGQRVIVLEKGGYRAEAGYHQREFDSFATLYENAGVLTTEDLGFVVLAGSTLGGGTAINWTASFRTPDYVLDEWEREHGLHGFTGPAFRAALDAVCEREHVGTDESTFNPQNQALHDGCVKLGYHAGIIPRNVHGCGTPPACGWCCFGCPSGAKQSTARTWLQDAANAGAEFVVNCHVDKVLIEYDKAVGVAATAGMAATGGSHQLLVRAKRVVVAAGALHTPAILIRSGIQNPNIGQNLRIHPVTSVRAEMPHLSEPWRGVMMAAYSDELVNLDGHHYGVKLETPPTHPGLMGFGTPWQSARAFKNIMTRAAHQAIFIVLCRDRGSGRITVDKRGRPRIHYQLSRIDSSHLLKGVEAGLRVALAAGAVEIGTGQSEMPAFKVGEAGFEEYIARMVRSGLVVNKAGLFSAHQMGTCRMGGNRGQSVLTHTGESWNVRNLYVADASTFPTPSGVNPMITIQAIAYKIARHILERG